MKIIKECKLLIQYKKAYRLARILHFGQKDKSGKDYIEHPKHLSEQCLNFGDKIVSILHDTIEDTVADGLFLRDNGIDLEFVKDVVDLSRRKNQSYKEYVEHLYANGSDRAIRVKLLDLKHNMQIDRLSSFSKKSVDRVAKYATTYIYLKTGEWVKEI